MKLTDKITIITGGGNMMEQKSGVVINMSSCAAEMGLAKRAAYSATKGAVLALTKAMQVDYTPYQIRVNSNELLASGNMQFK